MPCEDCGKTAMDELFVRIKRDLPNFPDEVLMQWIYPFAKTRGWPPESDKWKYTLTESINDWKKATWKLEKIDLAKINFTRLASDGFLQMCRCYLNGEKNEYTHLKTEDQGNERFISSLRFILEHDEFPVPIVLKQIGCAFEIMDGNHRYLAWYAAKIFYEQLQTAPHESAKELREKIATKWRIPVIKRVSDIQSVWIATIPQ